MWAILVCGCVAFGLGIRWRGSGLGLWEFLGSGLVYLYARCWHRCDCAVPAGLPPEGPAIVIANHTCSADPAFLTAACRRRLRFIVGVEYYRIPVLGRVFDALDCLPVTRNGRDVRAPRAALRKLGAGHVLCLFPEAGLGNAGRTRPRRAKAGAAFLAIRAGVAVFPAYIRGGPQTSDILAAWVRRSRASVRFGPPVDLSAYAGMRINRKVLEEATHLLMAQIAALGPPSARADDEPRRATTPAALDQHREPEGF
jgi:1-acyl-sn-glycerol-3-phosphate acyltransferase